MGIAAFAVPMIIELITIGLYSPLLYMDNPFDAKLSIMLIFIALKTSVEPMISSDFPMKTFDPCVPLVRIFPEINAFSISSLDPYSKDIPPPNISAVLS